jgi:hypothetical protein
MQSAHTHTHVHTCEALRSVAVRMCIYDSNYLALTGVMRVVFLTSIKFSAPLSEVSFQLIIFTRTLRTQLFSLPLTLARLNCRFPLYHVIIAFGLEPVLSHCTS